MVTQGKPVDSVIQYQLHKDSGGGNGGNERNLLKEFLVTEVMDLNENPKKNTKVQPTPSYRIITNVKQNEPHIYYTKNRFLINHESLDVTNSEYDFCYILNYYSTSLNGKVYSYPFIFFSEEYEKIIYIDYGEDYISEVGFTDIIETEYYNGYLSYLLSYLPD